MKTTILLLPLLATALLTGCEPCRHYSRTQVTLLAPALTKRPYDTVKLYQDKSELAGQSYDVIAFMSVSGDEGDEARFIKAFLYHAADVGADGLIFYRGGDVAGKSGTDMFIAGNRGGFMIPSRTTLNGIYRGEAIHLK